MDGYVYLTYKPKKDPSTSNSVAFMTLKHFFEAIV
jgi:hypothetical protein